MMLSENRSHFSASCSSVRLDLPAPEHSTMKTIAIVIASLIVFSGAAHAADATAPVKEVMDATKSNWADNNSDWTDIFDASRLDHLYSKDFVAKYQAAAQFPAADDDGISPFDYDV